jgi:hypothetical protein
VIPSAINGGYFSQLYRVRYYDGKVQIYGVGGDRMYQINGKRLPHETVAAAGEVYDWWDKASIATINAHIC